MKQKMTFITVGIVCAVAALLLLGWLFSPQRLADAAPAETAAPTESAAPAAVVLPTPTPVKTPAPTETPMPATPTPTEPELPVTPPASYAPDPASSSDIQLLPVAPVSGSDLHAIGS